MKKKLIKIPLQFFGEPEEDFDDEFYEEEDEEDFDDEFYEEEDEDLGGGDDAEDADEDAADPEEEEQADDGAEDGEGTEDAGEGGESGEDANAALIAELKALGYVGDDLAALTSDMKTKREARETADKSKARKADLAASKAHVKGSRPKQGANGDASGGFSERQVTSFAEVAGCSKEEARKLLREQMKLMT